MAVRKTMSCIRCGGLLPMRTVWEARRGSAGECAGAVDLDGRCKAFANDIDTWSLNDMVLALLNARGATAVGHILAEAQEWLDYDFTPAQASSWHRAGVWDAAKAASFRNSGITPKKAKAYSL